MKSTKRKRRVLYHEYMASDAWARKRRRYFAAGLPSKCLGLRADGQACGAGPVDLHHWTYERLGHERLADLIPLCRECHARVHEFARQPGTDLKRATILVCGGPAFAAHVSAAGKSYKARKPKAPRSAPRPDPKRPALPNWADELLAAPTSVNASQRLADGLDSFGAALRRGERGKAIRRRASALAVVAEQADRLDVARALRAYRPPQGIVYTPGAAMLWDKHMRRAAAARGQRHQ